MGRLYLAAIKLSLALVSVGVMILLVAKFMGLMPDSREVADNRRTDWVNVVTTMTVDDVLQDRWTTLSKRLQRLSEDNSEVLSIGV